MKIETGRLEYNVDFADSKFDHEKRIIKGVSLLGPSRKDGKRDYTESCLSNAVTAGLFEGVQAFINHPSLEEEKQGRRDVRNLAGYYDNTRIQDGMVKADAHLLNNDNGNLYIDIAENMPNVAGHSQFADGKWRRENGKQIVDELTKVFSVDLVASGATTNGMFDSENSNLGDSDMEWTDVTGALLLAHKPDIHGAIIAEGAKTRDSEVTKLVEDNKALKLKVDGFELVESAAKKKEQVTALIESEKLPKEAATDVFVDSLLSASDEDAMKKLITDRKELLESVSGGVKGMGGDSSNKGKLKEGSRMDAKAVAGCLRGEAG